MTLTTEIKGFYVHVVSILLGSSCIRGSALYDKSASTSERNPDQKRSGLFEYTVYEKNSWIANLHSFINLGLILSRVSHVIIACPKVLTQACISLRLNLV